MFLIDDAGQAKVTIILAHGAGAPMDSPSLTEMAQALARSGLRIARFEFNYMAERRRSGERKPPPRAERLCSEYSGAIESLRVEGALIIGGKSLGGRVASMIADDLHASGRIIGLLCLGYPFHPPGKPFQLRTAHLEDLKTPTLIVQGTRDQFGSREEVSAYKLSKNIGFLWLEDGDHDLKPRKSLSGFSAADHLKTMGGTVDGWAEELVCR
jgi:uncharacterized protein